MKYSFWLIISFFFFLFLSLEGATFLNIDDSFDSGPILYLPFNGNVKDESGFRNKVFQEGGRLTSDRYLRGNKAFEFDGINDFLEIPDSEGRFSLKKLTITFWFNTSSNSVQNLIGKENFETAEEAVLQLFINWENYPGLGFNLVSGNTYCTQANYLTSSYVHGGNPISLNTWHFVAATWDGNNQCVYLNGKLLQSKKPGFKKIKSCNSPLRIGIWYQGSLPFKGKIDEVRIYKRVLSNKQINKLGHI